MEKNLKYIVVTLLLCFVYSHGRTAIPFYHYGVAEGLTESRIIGIAQDSVGFIWLAGDYSLTRFDGHNFRNYANTVQKKQPWNKINTVFTGTDGLLWIGSDQGFLCYDFLHDEFNTPIDGMTDMTVNDFAEEKNHLWLATEMGMAEFNHNTRQLVWITGPESVNVKDERIFDIINLTHIASQPEGFVWMVTPQGLIRINPVNSEFVVIEEVNGIPLNDSEVNHMEFRNNTLFIGTVNHGLIKLSSNGQEVKKIVVENFVKTVHHFQLVSDSVIWLATDNGLIHLNLQNESFQRFTNVPQDPLSLNRTAVSFVFADKQENLWVSNGIRGIDYGLNNILFEHLMYSENQPYTVSEKEVTAVDTDLDGNLWVGYESGLIEKNSYDPLLKTKYYLRSPETGKTFGSVFKIFEDSHNHIWAGGWMSGLWKLNESGNEFVRAEIRPDSMANLVKYADIRDIAEGPEGDLWITLHGIGLGRYNPKNKQIKLYRNNPQNWTDGVSNDYTYDVCFDNQLNIWVSSAYGISRMDPNREKFTVYVPNPNDSITLSSSFVKMVHYDKTGRIWAGTDNGLNVFVPGLNTFQPVYTDFDLSFSSISAIESVRPGEIWVSTRSGLMNLTYDPSNKLDKISYSIEYFYPSNGLLSTIYFDRSSAQQGNLIYFGGNEGLDFFNAVDVTPKKIIPPRAVVTAVSVYDNQVYPRTGDKNNLPVLDLNYDQKMVSFRFTSLNFTNPEQQRFRYKLENFDNQWVYPLDEKVATYTNLRNGKYKFIIQVSDKNGQWKDNSTPILLQIHPPFWRTIPFIILSALALFSLIYLLLHIRYRNMRLRQAELEYLVSQRTRELLQKNEELKAANQTKNKFFSIIAHDLRSPFSGLLGIMELLKESEEISANQKSLVKTAYNSATSTFGLLENLLVWARSQSKKIDYNPELFDLNKILNKNLQLSREQAQQKSIHIFGHFREPVNVFADLNMVDTVVRNLLNNAIKFTPKGGSVVVRTITNERKVTVSVADSGIGLTTEQKEQLFKLNTKSKTGTNGESGTGLGLVISKEFINKNNGEIWATDNQPTGAVFYFTIPADNNNR